MQILCSASTMGTIIQAYSSQCMSARNFQWKKLLMPSFWAPTGPRMRSLRSHCSYNVWVDGYTRPPSTYFQGWTPSSHALLGPIGQLFTEKSVKFVPPDLKAKMHQIRFPFPLGLYPRSRRRAYSGPTDTLVVFRWPTSKRSEGKGGWEGRKGEKKRGGGDKREERGWGIPQLGSMDPPVEEGEEKVRRGVGASRNFFFHLKHWMIKREKRRRRLLFFAWVTVDMQPAWLYIVDLSCLRSTGCRLVGAVSRRRWHGIDVRLIGVLSVLVLRRQRRYIFTS